MNLAGLGGVLVCGACTVGSVLNFFIGRFLARDWARAQMAKSPTLQALDQALEERALFMIALVRLSPVFPFAMLGYVFGTMAVGVGKFTLGMMYLPFV